MSDCLMTSSTVMALFVIPTEVMWSYCVFGLILAIGVVTIFVRGEWQRAAGLDKLVLFGPIFYAAPLAAFGTEHFTITKEIATMVPSWIPWHLFVAYFVGTCFIAAGLSMVTKVQSRLAAGLVALTFFLFVVLMDVPAWTQDPRNRFTTAIALRELSFSGGPLALVASLTDESRTRHILATVARYFVGIPVLVYSFEQFLHGDHVPGVPLALITPTYVFGHAIWTYVVALLSAVAGILLVIGKKTRAAAAWLGLTLFLVELVVYVPIAVMEPTSFLGFNYMADSLMFCGTVLLLAGGMPREG